MPSTNPFSIEYLLGGIQTASILLFALITSGEFSYTSKIEEISTAIGFICLLSFAYPIGIMLDNLGAFILSCFYKPDELHRMRFNILLKENPDFQVKRALEFQTTKRVIRITSVNSLLALIVVFTFINCENITFTVIIRFLSFVLFLGSVNTYAYIEKNYHKYLFDLHPELSLAKDI
jgi:hypothetical protein